MLKQEIMTDEMMPTYLSIAFVHGGMHFTTLLYKSHSAKQLSAEPHSIMHLDFILVCHIAFLLHFHLTYIWFSTFIFYLLSSYKQ